jgi:hypothetical protein
MGRRLARREGGGKGRGRKERERNGRGSKAGEIGTRERDV